MKVTYKNKAFRAPAEYDKSYGIDLLDTHGKVSENVGTYAAARWNWYQAEKAHREAMAEDQKLRAERARVEEQNVQIRADWFAAHPNPTAKQLEKLSTLLVPLPKRKPTHRVHKCIMRYYAPGGAPEA